MLIKDLLLLNIDLGHQGLLLLYLTIGAHQGPMIINIDIEHQGYSTSALNIVEGAHQESMIIILI